MFRFASWRVLRWLLCYCAIRTRPKSSTWLKFTCL